MKVSLEGSFVVATPVFAPISVGFSYIGGRLDGYVDLVDEGVEKSG